MKALYGYPLLVQVIFGILGLILLLALTKPFFLRIRNFWRGLKMLDVKDRFGIKNEFIKTTAQVLGGIFFLLTLYYTAENLRVSHEKNVTDLFTKAVEQLGKDKPMEVRVGGIYALERISRTSSEDYWTIMEILTAYVRENAPWPPRVRTEPQNYNNRQQSQPTVKQTLGKEKQELKQTKPSTDIQAILNILRRRQYGYKNGEDKRLDLSNTDLRGADLRDAPLRGIILSKANLQGKDTDLTKADLREAELKEVILSNASLRDADLRDADFFYADLQEAMLHGAKFEGANFGGADLRGARLEEEDLRGVVNLTKKQVSRAYTTSMTKLPIDMRDE